MSTYKISKLSVDNRSTYNQNNNSLPILKVKNPKNNSISSSYSKDIFIPHVNKDDPDVYNDELSVSTIDSSILPGKTKNIGKSSPRKVSQSLTHPIKSFNKNEITIELDPIKNSAITKLDILETFLPRKFRNEIHEKKRLKVKQVNHYNLVNTMKGSGDIMNNTSYRFLTEQLSNSSILQKSQSLSVLSYKPIHYSSGASVVDSMVLSHSEDINDEVDSFADQQQQQQNMIQNDNYGLITHDHELLKPMSATHPINNTNFTTTMNKSSSNNNLITQRRCSLWVTSSSTKGMEEREKARQMKLEAELKKAMDEQLAIEQQKQAEERKKLLKVKVLNTFFDSKWRLKEVIEATKKKFKEIKIAAEFKAKLEKEGAEGEKSLETNELQKLDSSNNVPIQTNKDEHDINVDLIQKASNNQQQLQPQQQQQSSILSTIDRTARFTNAEFRNRKLQKEIEKHSIAKVASNQIISTFNTIATGGGMKKKLKNLAVFINSHTSRKLLDCWNFIEAKFKASTYTKTRTQIVNGYSQPVKDQALTSGTLAYILCSSKIKIGHEELGKLYTSLELTEDEIFHARKLAALQVLTNVGNEAKGKSYDKYMKDLYELLKSRNDPLISLYELIEVTFSSDENERAGQFDVIVTNRSAQIQALMDEKKTKDELKKKTEQRRIRMIHDFEESLSVVQLMRGVLTASRLQEFADLVETCKVYIEQQKEDQVSNIQQDLIAYIGLNAFPLSAIEKIKEKNRLLELRREAYKKQQQEQANTLNNNKAVLLQSNPFLKKKELTQEDVKKAQLLLELKEEEKIVVVSNKNTTEEDDDEGVPVITNKNYLNQSISNPLENTSDNKPIFTPIVTEESQTITELKSSLQTKTTHLNQPRKLAFRFPRILLAGPPSMLATLREMVSYGRGLQGMSYQEAVSILQNTCVTKISSIFRCFKRRWRYNKACYLKRKKNLELLKKLTYEWEVFTKHNVNTRCFCYRKLIAWRYYTRSMIRRRNLFRCTFWPFYIWHKYANNMGKAKEKTKFLVGRVMPTLLKLRIFKYWKIYTKIELKYNNKSDKYNQILIHKRSIDMFYWLRTWSLKRKRIRKAWYRKGKYMLSNQLHERIYKPFVIWRIYANYRKNIRNRANINIHELRVLLLPNRKPIRLTSNSDKRLKLKIDYLKQFASNNKNNSKRKLSTKEMKKNLKQRVKAKKDKDITKRSNTKNEDVASKNDNMSDISNHEELSEDGSIQSSDTFVPYIPKGNFYDRVARLTQSYFRWDCNISYIYDVDSDNEEENEDIDIEDNNNVSNNNNVNDKKDVNKDINNENVPNKKNMIDRHGDVINHMYFPQFILQKYNHIKRPVLMTLEDMSFTSKLTKNYEKYVNMIPIIYSNQEKLNCFEGALRFHRFGYRAFNNLRMYARFKRKAKNYRLLRNKRIKLFVLKELNRCSKIRIERDKAAQGSEAERLSLAIRSHQLSKVIRSRKLTNEVNNALGRNDNDDIDEDEARIKRMKRLNLIDPEDEAYLESEKQRLIQRRNELKRKRLEQLKKYNPPNLLEMDRMDRDIEQKNVENILIYSQKVKLQTLELISASDEYHSLIRINETKVNNMLQEVLQIETDLSSKAIDKQLTYAKNFKIHAAEKMLDVLTKIYLEVQLSLLKEEAKIYFRCLRIPMLLSRTKSMYQRKRLMNMLRICNRLKAIEKKAMYYQRIRSKWIIFNRWLKFIAMEKLNPTPGFIHIIKRKAAMHPVMERKLKNLGVSKSVYVDNKEISDAMTETNMVFNRWKSYTQEVIIFQLFENKVADLFRLRLLQKCFVAIKTGLHISECLYIINTDVIAFPFVRVMADIEQITKRFLAERRRSLSRTVRKYNRKYLNFVMKDGKEALSFKSFSEAFITQANARISTEQRMLSDSFETRGTQIFTDIRAPDRNHPIIPPIMARLDGKTFSDPHINTVDGRSVAIPGGYKLSRIKFSFQTGYGILGWQLFWSADGAKEIESAQRGSWHSMALVVHEFTIPKDDFVIGVDYLYDGPVIVGIRLKLLSAGYTQWIGGKTSLSTLSLSLDVHFIPREEFEDDRDANLDPDEKEDPALPYNIVIGFTGVMNDSKATCLGLVIRKIRKQHLFSYTWIGDVLNRLEAKNSHLAVANKSSNISIDIKSIPTHISPKKIKEFETNDGGSTIQDSLTMSIVPQGRGIHSENVATYSKDVSMLEFNDDNSSIESNVTEMIDNNNTSRGVVTNTLLNEDNHENQSLNPLNNKKARERREAVSIGILSNNNSEVLLENSILNDGLSSSEVQFFDIIRMRTTELSHSLQRANQFSRRIWTDKDLKLHPVYGKLISIRIVAGLTSWYFNALSKRLIPLSTTEKPALNLLKKSRYQISKADTLRNRIRMMSLHLDELIKTKQLWTGKALLSPQERQLKKEYLQRIESIKAEITILKSSESNLRIVAAVDEQKGLLLLPKIILSRYVVNNFKLKLEAARHKESLLQRMTLDEVKNGLFGSNLKEKMLSKDQMQAIHESLKTQNLKLKDLNTLEHFIDDIFKEEAETLEYLNSNNSNNKLKINKKGFSQLSNKNINLLKNSSNSNYNTSNNSNNNNNNNNTKKTSGSITLKIDQLTSNPSSRVNTASENKLILTDRTSTPIKSTMKLSDNNNNYNMLIANNSLNASISLTDLSDTKSNINYKDNKKKK